MSSFTDMATDMATIMPTFMPTTMATIMPTWSPTWNPTWNPSWNPTWSPHKDSEVIAGSYFGGIFTVLLIIAIIYLVNVSKSNKYRKIR